MARKDSVSKKRAALTKEDWQIYSFLIPAAILVILFSYIPMYGLVMASRIIAQATTSSIWPTPNGSV